MGEKVLENVNETQAPLTGLIGAAKDIGKKLKEKVDTMNDANNWCRE